MTLWMECELLDSAYLMSAELKQPPKMSSADTHWFNSIVKYIHGNK